MRWVNTQVGACNYRLLRVYYGAIYTTHVKSIIAELISYLLKSMNVIHNYIFIFWTLQAPIAMYKHLTIIYTDDKVKEVYITNAHNYNYYT